MLDEAEQASGKAGSQIQYRRSQAITSNLSSSLEDLKKAKEYIEMAIQLKPMEKLFKSPNKILVMLNLDNTDEAYSDQAHLVMKRIEERRAWELDTHKPIFLRLKKTHQEKLAWQEKHGEKKKHYDPFPAKAIDFMDQDYEYDITKE